MNQSSADDHLSLLSEPIGPVHASDLAFVLDRRHRRPSLPHYNHDHQHDHQYREEEMKEPTSPQPPQPVLPKVAWNEWDVPIGRGRAVREFVGNERYRDLIEQHRPVYLQAQKRKDKRDVSITVYNIIKLNGGRFLAPASAGSYKRNSTTASLAWYEISREKALAKIGQALRIGLRPPQYISLSSSWTYPIDHGRNFQQQSAHSSHPLFVNMPLSTATSTVTTTTHGDMYGEVGHGELGDNISNVSSYASDSPTPYRDTDFNYVDNHNRGDTANDYWQSTSNSLEPFPFQGRT